MAETVKGGIKNGIRFFVVSFYSIRSKGARCCRRFF